MNIQLLNQTDKQRAREMHKVFQRSYSQEAKLLEIEDFPPLQRSSVDLSLSESLFYGVHESENLAAVIELECQHKRLEINSLVVDPDYFRRGYAENLMRFVLQYHSWKIAHVETARANLPAISLYAKLGFVLVRHWLTKERIAKVEMRLKNSNQFSADE